MEKKKVEDKTLAKKELSLSDRFTNMVIKEFSSTAVDSGSTGLTAFHKRLCQNYFIVVDGVLRKAELGRMRKAEINRDSVAVTWENLNMNQLHIALYQPEIPPNTGNIIRLCANTGTQLHLIHPLGFTLEEKQLRRAGLDYRESVNIKEYAHFDDFISRAKPKRLLACSTKAKRCYTDISYEKGDVLLFGPETRGLPQTILSENQCLRIPMMPNSRSLNLSNASAIVLYEAWRQMKFL